MLPMRAFVSSTYKDLKDHRAYVIQKLAQCGIFVDPMEKWTAAADEPKMLSRERVRDCDLCILLVGFRRGHVPEGELLSITQMEYREAIRREIDVLVFMAAEEADWPARFLGDRELDPKMEHWRAELKEHKVAGFFTPSPESIDVISAVYRWSEERRRKGRRTPQPGLDDKSFAIDIRACSNSEAILISWRTEQPIKGCLGFALYRKVLGDAGVTEEVVKSYLPFESELSGALRTAAPSTSRPIQNFRWTDHSAPSEEVRYRAIPVVGNPASLKLYEDAASGWTNWVSRQTAQTPGYRAFFRRTPVGFLTQLPRNTRDQQSIRRRSPGAELPGTLLQSLIAARGLHQRIYAAVSDLDDREIIAALKSLRQKMHIILPFGTRKSATHKNAARSRLIRELRRASVRVYERPPRRGRASLYNFAVFCDRWGTPSWVWTGSASWTSRALWQNANNCILIDSVASARAYLDRWENLRDSDNGKWHSFAELTSRPEQISLSGSSITLWNSPVKANADLRDATRLIRGARQGILFLIGKSPDSSRLLDDILAMKSKDIFIQGISSHCSRDSKGMFILHDLVTGRKALVDGKGVIDSTVIVVDPFGPHPALITGSHDLTTRTSQSHESDLLIVENAPGLTAEYAVHVIGVYDQNNFRFRLLQSRSPGWVGLKADDTWQRRYFDVAKRSEFNFLFGRLSPGL